jgi:hypothetical protein
MELFTKVHTRQAPIEGAGEKGVTMPSLKEILSSLLGALLGRPLQRAYVPVPVPVRVDNRRRRR